MALTADGLEALHYSMWRLLEWSYVIPLEVSGELRATEVTKVFLRLKDLGAKTGRWVLPMDLSKCKSTR